MSEEHLMWERALVMALQREWERCNYQYFNDSMRRPALELLEGLSPLGRYDPNTRSLGISKELVMHHPWAAVAEVLRHEAAHQYVFEVLGVTGEAPHGNAFSCVCARLRIDARAVGIPTGGMPGAVSPEEEKVLRRVEKLLALAQSSNQHEAQAAMQAARDLLVSHNLLHTPKASGDSYVVRQLGRPKLRHGGSERVLAHILMEHFFVNGVWLHAYDPQTQRDGWIFEITGTRANVEVAVYVHSFLSATAERLFEEDKIVHGSGRYKERFMFAALRGFSKKLQASKPAEQSQAMVRVMDAGLKAYMAARHPKVTAGRGSSYHLTDVDKRGEVAGSSIVLHKGVDGGTAQRGRLLAAG